VTIIATALIFGLGGALIGMSLIFRPELLSRVFKFDRPGIQPSGVGFGLGLTEGMMLGLCSEWVLVFILTWRETRLPNEVARQRPPETKTPCSQPFPVHPLVLEPFRAIIRSDARPP